MKCYESKPRKLTWQWKNKKQPFDDVSPIKQWWFSDDRHVGLLEGKSMHWWFMWFFLWAVPWRGFHTLLVPVNEVVKQDEEDFGSFFFFFLSFFQFSYQWCSFVHTYLLHSVYNFVTQVEEYFFKGFFNHIDRKLPAEFKCSSCRTGCRWQW